MDQTVFEAPTITIPTNLEEANELLARVRELQRGIATIDTQCESQVGELETEFAPFRIKHEQAVEDLKKVAKEQKGTSEQELEELTRVLHTYAARNRASLLTGRSKTVSMSNGEICWKLDTGVTVIVESGEEETVIRRIKRKGGELKKKFLVLKESLNRRALGTEKPVIKGITYKQGETFIIQVISDIPGGQEVFEPIKMPA